MGKASKKKSCIGQLGAVSALACISLTGCGIASEMRTAGLMPTLAPTSTPTPTPRGDCSPCYPTICIPGTGPHLDCGQISHRRFPMVGCDLHRFDGDHDGVGCERQGGRHYERRHRQA